VFEKKNVDILLEHWPYGYIIDLEKGAQPYLDPFINCCNMNSRPFNNTLVKIWNKVSFNIQIPVGAMILFVEKQGNSIHTCINYQGLNWLTIKNWQSLPLISRLLKQINHAKV
jgi:hypothetical protein